EPDEGVRLVSAVTGQKNGIAADAVFPEALVGNPLFPEQVGVSGVRIVKEEPFVIRNFKLPEDNNEGRAIRPTDIAFLSDGVGLVCTFDGDVWRVEGLSAEEANWTRVATGIFEPMDIEVDGRDRIFVLGRDQVTELIDTNSDGHIDVYRNATDHILQTLHTRDYATSLVVEPDGSFLLAKGGIPSLDKGLEAEVGHRGQIVRISEDGKKVEVLADGLRLPYVGRRADGAIFASDQQGHYVPSTPLLRVDGGRPFFGFEPTKFRPGANVTEPLLWYPHQVNRSGAGFATLSEKGFPDLGGGFLQVSWNGRLFPVVAGEAGAAFSWQLPVQFDFPTLKGASHPETGELFVIGLGISGYKPTTPELSGLASIRQGAPMVVSTGLDLKKGRLEVVFAKPLTAVQSVGVSSLKLWDIKRTGAYGSGHFLWDGKPGEHHVEVNTVMLSEDRQRVVISVPPIYRSDIMALGLSITDGARSYPLTLFTRPSHLAKATAKELTEVRKREGGTVVLKKGDAVKGMGVFTGFACSGCHSLSGEKLAGPPLNGVATRAQKESQGLDVYLRESILTPNKLIAAGYEPAMPSFEGVLPAQDLENLLAYLKTLK
ncbi:cytochrome c, partial [Akkermansiaceae bacterium]|nr:cytochrome c [Akkermansiaceae bacterium]